MGTIPAVFEFDGAEIVGYVASALVVLSLTMTSVVRLRTISLAGSVVFALGLAPVYTLAADIMVGAAPPERAGAAAGISETSSEFGGALGIAILGAIGTAVYRGEVEDALPAGVPAEAAEGARDTLGAAVAGDGLPGLVEAARDAFTEALQLAATVSGAAVIAAAALMLWVTGRGEPRRLRPEAS